MRHRALRRCLSAAAVALVVTAVAATGLAANAFDGFQRRASDALLPSAKADRRVVVVGIDSRTINATGQVPLARSLQAKLAEQLTAAGAKAIVYDVVFTGSRDGDAELAAALAGARAPVIGASYVTKTSKSDPSLLEVVRTDLAPNEALADAGNTTVAHVNVINDPADGVVRSVPLVVSDHGTLVPALSLEAFRIVRGASGPITVRPDGLQVGDRFVPTEGEHLLRLNFADGLKPDDKKSIVSALDVLNGTADPARFKDAVVFIGATTPLLGDAKLVPVDKSNTYPGVLIHANALNTMLTASYLSPVSNAETVAWVALVALLVALAVLFLPIWLAVISSLLIAIGYLFVGYLRFDAGHVMNLVYPFAAIVLAFMGALGVRYVTETRQRRRVSSLFAQYVPEEVAKQLEESGHLDEHMDGERLDVGLFFCDLRGFTSLSATLEPGEVRGMLNYFYELVTDAILGHGGTVLKFVGDEVFAVFGAPLPVEDHAQVALDCAMEIQRRVPELDAQLADLDIDPVKFGIGMNAGDVVAAHVGGGKRRQYDVVGDTVNVASRLCGQAGKGEIVLPESMIARLPRPPEMEPMGAVQLKGLDEPVYLFKVTVGDSEPRVQPAAAQPATRP